MKKQVTLSVEEREELQRFVDASDVDVITIRKAISCDGRTYFIFEGPNVFSYITSYAQNDFRQLDIHRGYNTWDLGVCQ